MLVLVQAGAGGMEEGMRAALTGYAAGAQGFAAHRVGMEVWRTPRQRRLARSDSVSDHTVRARIHANLIGPKLSPHFSSAHPNPREAAHGFLAKNRVRGAGRGLDSRFLDRQPPLREQRSRN